MSGDEHDFPTRIDRNHLPEPEWAFPNAKIGFMATESRRTFRR